MVGCVEKQESGDGREDILELDIAEVRRWVVPAEGSGVPAPRSITIGPDDQVLVLDNGGRVLVYSKDGTFLKRWDMPTNEDGNPEGACWLRDGRIVVADTHYYRLVVFNEHGDVVEMRGEKSESGEAGKYIFPVDIVQDKEDGRVYVAEYGGNDRVQVFEEDGSYVMSFGKMGTGPGEFQRCAGMFLRGDEVWVADAVNGRVHIFGKDGGFRRMLGQEKKIDDISSNGEIDVIAGSDDGLRRGPWGELIFNYPYDIAEGDDGVYVLEWGGGRFVKVGFDGEVKGYYGEPGSKLGEFRTPWGIGVDSRGKLRVADTENRRIVEVVLE
ncbi:6-bladed beta-propeller [Poriferisphaera corsica]|nr:6-bladed beta-propeller [Poriferisphaera corsica]